MKNNDLLVDGIRLAIIGSTLSFIERFPVLKTILSQNENPSEKWDNFMTAAGTGIYFLTNKSNEREVLSTKEKLSIVNKQLPQLVDHFFKFMTEWKQSDVQSPTETFVTGIGYWVIWNMTEPKITTKEYTILASAIGTYLTRVVSDFSNSETNT